MFLINIISLKHCQNGLLQVFGLNRGHFGIAGLLKCYIWDSKHQLWTLLLVSTYNLVCLNFERWFSIKFPFKYKVLLKKKHIIIVCMFNWLLWIGYNSARFMATTEVTRDGICHWYVVWPDNPVYHDAHWVFNVVLWFGIPCLCLIFTNLTILLHIKQRNKMWQDKTENNTTIDTNAPKSATNKVATETDAKAAKVEMNILKTLISVSAAFGFCLIWNIAWIFMYIAKAEFANNAIYYDFSVLMMFCNVVINPFLYAAQYTAFQQQARTILCRCCKCCKCCKCCRCCRHSQERNQDDSVNTGLSSISQ